MMKFKGLIVSIVSMMAFGALVPAVVANAEPWQMKYSSGYYKVRVKKTTKVYKIKFGKASYLNNYVGTYKLRKGSIVKTVYYGRNSFKWLLRGSKKFKSNGKYAYTADFKKNSFKVISHSN